MRPFLDECVDRRLAKRINGHEVRTARQMGWTSIKNGELLKRAAQAFDVFITVDRNLAFRQNVEELPITVLVLRAKTNRLVDLLPLIDVLQERLGAGVSKAIYEVTLEGR